MEEFKKSLHEIYMNYDTVQYLKEENQSVSEILVYEIKNIEELNLPWFSSIFTNVFTFVVYFFNKINIISATLVFGGVIFNFMLVKIIILKLWKNL